MSYEAADGRQHGPGSPISSSTGTTLTRTEGASLMGSTANHVPKYRHFKPKNLGFVRIDGRDYYLGKFGSPESYEKYHRILAERYARGPIGQPRSQGARPQSEVLTIAELILGYYRHCERYYVKN